CMEDAPPVEGAAPLSAETQRDRVVRDTVVLCTVSLYLRVFGPVVPCTHPSIAHSFANDQIGRVLLSHLGSEGVRPAIPRHLLGALALSIGNASGAGMVECYRPLQGTGPEKGVTILSLSLSLAEMLSPEGLERAKGESRDNSTPSVLTHLLEPAMKPLLSIPETLGLVKTARHMLWVAVQDMLQSMPPLSCLKADDPSLTSIRDTETACWVAVASDLVSDASSDTTQRVGHLYCLDYVVKAWCSRIGASTIGDIPNPEAPCCSLLTVSSTKDLARLLKKRVESGEDRVDGDETIAAVCEYLSLLLSLSPPSRRTALRGVLTPLLNVSLTTALPLHMPPRVSVSVLSLCMAMGMALPEGALPALSTPISVQAMLSDDELSLPPGALSALLMAEREREREGEGVKRRAGQEAVLCLDDTKAMKHHLQSIKTRLISHSLPLPVCAMLAMALCTSSEQGMVKLGTILVNVLGREASSSLASSMVSSAVKKLTEKTRSDDNVASLTQVTDGGAAAMHLVFGALARHMASLGFSQGERDKVEARESVVGSASMLRLVSVVTSNLLGSSPEECIVCDSGAHKALTLWGGLLNTQPSTLLALMDGEMATEGERERDTAPKAGEALARQAVEDEYLCRLLLGSKLYGLLPAARQHPLAEHVKGLFSVLRKLHVLLDDCDETNRILIVGAGGIGCELAKLVVQCQFEHVEFIDLDTIDLSNLNRQFVFSLDTIGTSKALTCAAYINDRIHKKCIGYHDNIFSEAFGPQYFMGFDVVINALDNAAARARVSLMCTVAGVPLVDAGTAGHNGTVSSFIPNQTGCFGCTGVKDSDNGKGNLPVCTVRTYPSKPHHCIVYAETLLGRFRASYDEQSDKTSMLSDVLCPRVPVQDEDAALSLSLSLPL
ncbi:hypothetical protein KIPB_005932, partial [Kipferlia bialata]